MGVQFDFGGTSLLIVVGVAMDTVQQIEAQIGDAPLRWIPWSPWKKNSRQAWLSQSLLCIMIWRCVSFK